MQVDDFIALRLDVSYAACRRTLHEVTCRLPGFQPTRVLEFAAGLVRPSLLSLPSRVPDCRA